MDWTRTGASPPTSTQPTLIFRDFRRSGIRDKYLRRGSVTENVEEDLPLLGLVQLDQE
jgi:hypothetical protein